MLKSVGIDIGTSSIKVLEIVASNKGLALHRFTDHPLSTNLNHDTELDIIEFLRKLASEYDPNNTVFSVALRQDQVATRYKNFPFRERQKILKSLPFELEEDLPMNPETAVYDAKILQYRGASAEVLACAASKEAVGNLVKLCADALIEPSLISCEGAALANWKENWTQAPPAIEGAALIDTSVLSKTVVIQMNLGHTHTVVNALEDGRLISSRTIYWGGKQIAEAIAKRYEISYEAALRELQLKGFILTSKGSASADQITFSDTISGAFKDLLKELRLYLLEIRSDFNAYINSIEITGGVSRVQNLGAFLTQNLEAPTNRASPLAAFGNVQFEKSPHNDSVSVIALGLAIEGLKKPRNPALNFLKGDFAKQADAFKNFWGQYGFTTQIALTAIVTLFIWGQFRVSATTALSEVSTEVLKDQAVKIARLPKKQANEAGVKRYIKDSKKRAADIKLVSGLVGMNSALDVAKKINDSIPPKNQINIHVKKMHIRGSQVTLEGVLGSDKDNSLLQSRLVGVASDGKVTPRQPSIPGEVGKVSFAYTFKVDRNVKVSK